MFSCQLTSQQSVEYQQLATPTLLIDKRSGSFSAAAVPKSLPSEMRARIGGPGASASSESETLRHRTGSFAAIAHTPGKLHPCRPQNDVQTCAQPRQKQLVNLLCLGRARHGSFPFPTINRNTGCLQIFERVRSQTIRFWPKLTPT